MMPREKGIGQTISLVNLIEETRQRDAQRFGASRVAVSSIIDLKHTINPQVKKTVVSPEPQALPKESLQESLARLCEQEEKAMQARLASFVVKRKKDGTIDLPAMYASEPYCIKLTDSYLQRTDKYRTNAEKRGGYMVDFSGRMFEHMAYDFLAIAKTDSQQVIVSRPATEEFHKSVFTDVEWTANDGARLLGPEHVSQPDFLVTNGGSIVFVVEATLSSDPSYFAHKLMWFEKNKQLCGDKELFAHAKVLFVVPGDFSGEYAEELMLQNPEADFIFLPIDYCQVLSCIASLAKDPEILVKRLKI